MLRLFILIITLLVSACANRRPLPTRYDLEGSVSSAALLPRLQATIAVSPINAPSWLRSTALLYRLDYEASSPPRAYTLRHWTAPPNELLTLGLRERIASVNQGLTLERLPANMDTYRLEVTLEEFMQRFVSPAQSRCAVTLSATLLGDHHAAIGQRTFHAERPAPSANAAGAVQCLTAAANVDYDAIVSWLGSNLSPGHQP